MTEAEWLAATDPKPILDFVRPNASDRKLRLLAVACCFHIWHLLPDKRSRKAVLIGERYADGLADLRALKAAADSAYSAACKAHANPRDIEGAKLSWEAVRAVVAEPLATRQFVLYAILAAMDVQFVNERLQAGEVIRDIFGNPFRPVTLDSSWLTSTVTTLASQMYESRDFSAMPILADALQDAGCTSDDVLAHCRGPGPHIRGCWVVDLVLGKG
jgi:hypothetical protein